jgi:thiamine kinase-like enzyme
MLKVAYIGLPRYLSLPILSSIAKEIKKVGVNFYIDTNEEEPNGVAVPDNFDMTLRINKELVTSAYGSIKSRNVLKTVKSVKTLKKHVNERMDFLNPDAIVATSDMGGLVTRLCNEWAVKHKRPFFIMQPSFLEVNPQSIKLRIINKLIYLAFNKVLGVPIGRRQQYANCERKTNYTLLWSGEFSNQMTQKYLENTFSVGNPLLDKFANQKVRIDVKKPVALICTQHYEKLVECGILKPHQALEIITMLTQAVQQNPDVHFIIKVHPSEDDNDYIKIFGGRYGSNFSITKTGDLTHLLNTADVQVSMASYTSFEAVVAGVPIIIIHPEFVDFFNQFEGIGFIAKSTSEFNRVLKISLGSAYRSFFKLHRERYLNKKLAYFGNSAETTANTIKKVVEWRKKVFK